MTEVRRLHQQHQVTCNATQKHLTPANATCLNMISISSALSDSAPWFRTLAATLSLSPVSVDDADAGAGAAALVIVRSAGIRHGSGTGILVGGV